MSDRDGRPGPKVGGRPFDQLHDVKTVAEDPDAYDDEITDEQAQPPVVPAGGPARPPTHRIFVTGARVLPLDDDDDELELPAEEPSELPPYAAEAEPAATDDPFDMPPTKLSDPDKKKAIIAAAAAASPPAVETVAGGSRGRPPVKLVDAMSPPPGAGHETGLTPGEVWQLAEGDVVGGRYSIIRPIARGGMAEVYLAEQVGVAGFAKKVVIKRILSAFVADQLFIDHFVREAHLASSLSHEHIAQVYDLGKDRGSYFIAMEYIPGVTLAGLASRAWEQGRSLSVELILLALADAAEGLVYGWRTRGTDGKPLRLVHRDISPDNLIINTHGTTKVLDYGVAKAADSADLTSAGEIKGKVSYVPPELLLENARDHRSDLYALGVTGYYLCTGERPFWHDNPTVLLQSILREDPPAPRSRNPHLPVVVEKMLLRLLHKDPDQRFADGQALSEHIHSVLGAVRRAAIGRFVADVMSNKQRRAIPANAPPAVVAIGLGGGSSEVPTGEWEKVPGE